MQRICATDEIGPNPYTRRHSEKNDIRGKMDHTHCTGKRTANSIGMASDGHNEF
jgi:hypothetical protein